MTKMTVGEVELRKVVGRTVLGGRPAGLVDRPKIDAQAMSCASSAGRVVLDFEGIEVLTASYFEAALWPLWARAPRELGIEALHPIVTKVGPDVIDDLIIGLREHGAAAWMLTGGGKVEDARLVGVVDEGTRRLLAALQEREEAVTARDLEEIDQSVGRTAWSNRLAALYDQRLVRRQKDGKRLLYSIAWRVN